VKRAALLVTGLLLGIGVGYATRSYVAAPLLMHREPVLTWAYLSNLGESFGFCAQKGAEEQLHYLALYEQYLDRALASYPNDSATQMYYAFAEVGLSSAEAHLNHEAESNKHMQSAQQRLKEIGWRDTSPTHIRRVVAAIYPNSGVATSGSPAAAPCSDSAAGQIPTH
jgi:hypothetical protein